MLYQAQEHAGDMIKLVVLFFKIRFSQIALIQRNVGMTLQFGSRRLCDKQKLPKFLAPFSRKTLGNVRHDGHCGAVQLISQAVIA